MTSSLAEEFTEPFDFERFRAGEEICSPNGEIVSFKKEDSGWCFLNENGNGFHISGIKRGDSSLCAYKMHPLDGWIEVKGKAPFVAKAGEWEYELVGGVIYIACYPTDYTWNWIYIKRARRILKFVSDGWIHCDGKTMPKEIQVLGMDDRIEFITGQGEVESGRKKYVITWFIHSIFPKENIIAVRALKKLEETAQQALSREAYTRYKANHAPPEPYVGLRDGEIEEIAGAAIAQMKPWWGK